jgi:hypothetical protein
LRSGREIAKSGGRALVLFLPTVPIPVLRQLILIDGQWADQFVIELAEFGAVLQEQNFKISRSKNCAGHSWDVKAPKGSDLDPADLLAQARENFSSFQGTKRIIDRRPYVKVEEYLAWPGRTFKEDIRVEAMNLPFEAAALGAGTKPWADQVNPDEAAQIKKRGQDWSKVYHALQVAAAVAEICSEQYFEGHTVLITLVAEQLRSFTEGVEKVIDLSNKFFDFELLPGSAIDLDEARQRAFKEAAGEVGILAQKAKIFSLGTFGCHEEARERAIELRKNMIGKALECAAGRCQHRSAAGREVTHE